jgi:protein kinase-like protein
MRVRRSTTISLGALLSVLAELPTAPSDRTERADRWGGWIAAPAAAWQELLRALPTDRRAFEAHFERDWDDVLGTLRTWCTGFRALDADTQQRYGVLFGRLAVLLVTLLSLDHSERYRTGRGSPVGPGEPAGPGEAGSAYGHDCAELCRPLLADPAVRAALADVYRPEPGSPEEARREWDGIDVDSLAFHRHGTTSFLLTGTLRQVSQGTRHRFALKCLLLPYLQIPTIARATREYARRYRRDEPGLRHLARLWASCDRWVLMDFVPGATLAERLAAERETGARTGRLRLDLLERYGSALFAALDELDRVGLAHQDLAPSNIVVADTAGGVSLTLLDLGVNYLYSHALPGESGPDFPYVAPEVRADGDARHRSDLYSVGQLLALIGTGGPAVGGIVPDDFYAETPLMARFLEDLLDADADRRLLLFRPEPDTPLYEQLDGWFAEELAALRAAYHENVAPAGADLRGNLAGMFRPFSGAPGRQRRLWQVRRRQRSYRRRDTHLPWLLGWSLVSAALFYLTGLLVVTYVLRNLGVGFGNTGFAVLQRAFGLPEDEIPLLDAVRAADYPTVDARHNLPLLAMGFTFVLVGAKYYQGLFAGLTALVTGRGAGRRLRVLAVLAEVGMRITIPVLPVAIALPVVVEGRWWLFSVASGMALVTFCNAAVVGYARAALRQARAAGLSTVPDRVYGVEKYGSWLSGNLLYAAVLWTIAPLLYVGILHDTLVYMVAVMIANIPQMYLIKCGIEAVPIRTGLGRACLAAERLTAIPDHHPTTALPERPISADRAEAIPAAADPDVAVRSG